MAVRANRAFLARAVRYLAGEAGVRQFLDIGTGIPAGNNTHEVAQSVAPQSRIVYVDNDPVVLLHARALLTSAPEGACAYLDADLRDTGKILAEAAGLLDFGAPVALMLLGILQVIPDSEAARVRTPGWRPDVTMGRRREESLIPALPWHRISSAAADFSARAGS